MSPGTNVPGDHAGDHARSNNNNNNNTINTMPRSRIRFKIELTPEGGEQMAIAIASQSLVNNPQAITLQHRGRGAAYVHAFTEMATKEPQKASGLLGSDLTHLALLGQTLTLFGMALMTDGSELSVTAVDPEKSGLLATSQADVDRLRHLLDVANGILCNVDNGDVENQSEDWNKAFRKWQEDAFGPLGGIIPEAIEDNNGWAVRKGVELSVSGGQWVASCNGCRGLGATTSSAIAHLRRVMEDVA